MVENPVNIAEIVEKTSDERSNEFIALLNDSLNKLKDDNRFTGDLSENEIFLTTLLHVSPVAAKNHQPSKLEYLHNFVLNSLVSNCDEYKIIIFLDLMDNFTVWHFQMIELLEFPDEYAAKKGISGDISRMSLIDLLKSAFPGINENFLKKIWEDLYTQGLLASHSKILDTTMSSINVIYNRTTELGAIFTQLISDPLS